jgi:hypothetical protein
VATNIARVTSTQQERDVAIGDTKKNYVEYDLTFYYICGLFLSRCNTRAFFLV